MIIKIIKKEFSVIALFAVLSGVMHAGAQSLSVTVSKNPVAVGEQFQVTFSLNASGSGFQGPSFSEFIVLGGPNPSTSIQIINGAMSQTQTFSYYLQAKAEGSFKIGSASVISGNKKLESPPFTITVIKGAPGRQGNAQQDRSQEDESGIGSDDLFMRVSVDKTTVWRGEGIVVTYKLYTRVQLVNYAVTKAPSLNGFWTQDIQLPSQLDLKTEVINGVQYGAGILKRVVLYPQQSGTLTVDPMEGEVIARIQVKQRRNSNDPFDIFNDPFFSNPFGFGSVRNVKLSLKSEAVRITVKELPLNAPLSFSGSVGKFSFDASMDKKETKANEPVTLKIKISGKGNLNLIDPPKFDFPPDIETYDPKVVNNFSTSISGTAGSKSFEYLLIPRHEGTYEIKPVEFSYFDLDKKNYVSYSSPSFVLKVIRGSGEAASALISSPSKAEVQMLGKDIRFIKTGETAFIRPGKTFYGSPVFWTLTASPALLFAGLLLFMRHREKQNADIRSVKSRRATAMAKKRLAGARRMLDQRNLPEFFNETANALWGFVSDRLSIPVSELSKDAAAESLRKRNVKEESISMLVQTLDQCELARFTSAASSLDPETIYNDSIRIITQLENEIKS